MNLLSPAIGALFSIIVWYFTTLRTDKITYALQQLDGMCEFVRIQMENLNNLHIYFQQPNDVPKKIQFSDESNPVLRFFQLLDECELLSNYFVTYEEDKFLYYYDLADGRIKKCTFSEYVNYTKKICMNKEQYLDNEKSIFLNDKFIDTISTNYETIYNALKALYEKVLRHKLCILNGEESICLNDLEDEVENGEKKRLFYLYLKIRDNNSEKIKTRRKICELLKQQ